MLYLCRKLLILLLIPLTCSERQAVATLYINSLLTHPRTLVTPSLLKDRHASMLFLLILLINKNRSCVRSSFNTAIVPMKRSVNSLMDFTNLKKISRQTQSIRQKHAADSCKKDFAHMETDATSSTLK